MPSWFKSRQMRKLANTLSAALILRSLLASRSRIASNPSVASWPLRFRVSTPKSSRPESMVPLPFRSSTSSASSDLTQPVPVLTPSASWSNKMTEPPSVPTVSMPSPSRSSTSGSRNREAVAPLPASPPPSPMPGRFLFLGSSAKRASKLEDPQSPLPSNTICHDRPDPSPKSLMTPPSVPALPDFSVFILM